MRYFLITGFDGGFPIEPYIVETYADYPQLPPNNFYRIRYYEPITKEEADEHLKNGINLL